MRPSFLPHSIRSALRSTVRVQFAAVVPDRLSVVPALSPGAAPWFRSIYTGY